MRDSIVIYVNGRRHVVSGERVFQSLSDFLRYDRTLPGTKVVCAEGDCGSCTVLVGRPDESGRELVYRTVTSCIQFLYQLDGTHVITVEGLTPPEGLNDVQEAMVRCQGTQCGYCTPGFVVSLAALFAERPSPSRQEICTALVGNLCRCTGYESIVAAARAVPAGAMPPLAALYPSPSLRDELARRRREAVHVVSAGREFFKPATLAEAVQFKAAHPGCTVISGGTDLGVQINKGRAAPQVLLAIGDLGELHELATDAATITIGAAVPLSRLRQAARDALPELGKILDRFGSPPIKNAGTLGGNLANGSPIADTLPALYVLGAEIELVGPGGARRVDVNEFFTGYKQTVMRGDELVARVIVPRPAAHDVFRLYKVSKRRDLDISSFTAAFWLKRDGTTIAAARAAYGGVGPNVLRLPQTESFLLGRAFDEQTFVEAGAIATAEIAPIGDVRGAAEYRRTLAANVLRKLYWDSAASPAGQANGPLRNGQEFQA